MVGVQDILPVIMWLWLRIEMWGILKIAEKIERVRQWICIETLTMTPKKVAQTLIITIADNLSC
jgi:hypothetical protein